MYQFFEAKLRRIAQRLQSQIPLQNSLDYLVYSNCVHIGQDINNMGERAETEARRMRPKMRLHKYHSKNWYTSSPR